jgi:hypothetical protein
MKGCWIGILATSALLTSAFGQNGVGLQALAITNVRRAISSDNSTIAAILEPQVALSPGQGYLIQVGEPRASGLTRFQLLSTGH